MLLALALAAAATTLPTVTVSVHAGPAIPRALVTMTIEEARAIYRSSGFELRVEPDAGKGVQVTFDDTPGIVRDGDRALGWITFASDVPEPDIHLSYVNAAELMEEAQGTAAASHMTRLERYTMLSRALGRALAHELGHFLLASKVHSKAGLMRPRRTASDFFSPFRDGFEISLGERCVISSRLTGVDLVASGSR